ncbi:MAG: 5,10-methylenetetrahydrofolate reductase [Actinomycetota bacterium]
MTREPVAGSPAPGPDELLARVRFEVVPLRGVEEQVAHLPPGSTVTVTCSPRKGVEATLELSEGLAAQGFRVAPHVSARLVRGRAHLAEIAAWIRESGTSDVFVVGGDAREPRGPYPSALALLSALADLGDPLPLVGVAAYPERHPLIDEDVLVRALLDKQPFAGYMVTQICFDASVIASWLAGIRRAGVHLPVYVGIPGALKRRKLLEVSLRVGVGDSIRYLTKHGSIVTRLVRGGSYRPDGLVDGVAGFATESDLGIAGFHVNTFNQVEGTERWRREALAANRWPAGPFSERYGDEHGSAS